MVAKVILFTTIIMLVFLVVYIKTLPYMDKWRSEQIESQRRKLEYTERMVTEAEKEYDERNR